MVWFSGMANLTVSFNFTPDPPWLPWRRNLGQNWLLLGLYKRFLRLQGGFQGWAIEFCQLHFFPTDPRCHGNEIWDKMGYNSACVGDFCEIFAPIGEFSKMGLECCQLHYFPTDPRCHANEI